MLQRQSSLEIKQIINVKWQSIRTSALSTTEKMEHVENATQLCISMNANFFCCRVNELYTPTDGESSVFKTTAVATSSGQLPNKSVHPVGAPSAKKGRTLIDTPLCPISFTMLAETSLPGGMLTSHHPHNRSRASAFWRCDQRAAGEKPIHAAALPCLSPW